MRQVETRVRIPRHVDFNICDGLRGEKVVEVWGAQCPTCGSEAQAEIVVESWEAFERLTEAMEAECRKRILGRRPAVVGR